jgi:hypothetical protein
MESTTRLCATKLGIDASGRREQSAAMATTPSYSIAQTLVPSIPIKFLTTGAGAEQKQYT